MLWVLGHVVSAGGGLVTVGADEFGAVTVVGAVGSYSAAEAADCAAEWDVSGTSGARAGTGAGVSGTVRTSPWSSVGGITGPDFDVIAFGLAVGFGYGIVSNVGNFPFNISVVYVDYRELFAADCNYFCNFRCCHSNVHELSVLVEFEDDVTRTDIFNGDFFGGICISGAEDGVAHKACEAAASGHCG